MALREFMDERGRMWLVCDVRPAYIERRGGVDRRKASRPGSPERRQRRPHRMVVPPRFRAGGLVFDTRGGRRRLGPVPPGWELRGDDELRALLADAEVLVYSG